MIWNYENYLYENLLSQKNQAFYEKFLLQKFGAIQYIAIRNNTILNSINNVN